MDINKLQELKSGEDVTVITRGDYQLIDVAMGIRIPGLTEVTLPLTPFVMDQLVMTNLTLVGEDDAPEAAEGRKPISGIENLRYEGSVRTEAARSKPTEDAFGGLNPAQMEDRTFGVEPKKAAKTSETSNEKDEIPQGARAGVKGTSRNEKATDKPVE